MCLTFSAILFTSLALSVSVSLSLSQILSLCSPGPTSVCKKEENEREREAQIILQKNIGCRWYSSIFFLRQPTGHWFSCQMGVCHWSPSVAKTDEDQRQPMFSCNIIWARERESVCQSEGSNEDTNCSHGITLSTLLLSASVPCGDIGGCRTENEKWAACAALHYSISCETSYFPTQYRDRRQDVALEMERN